MALNQPDSCVTVRGLFEVERKLLAPLYQRPYAWSRKNLDEFWEDVKKVEDGESEALFLGAIILKHEGPSDPSSGRLEQFLVLDGQQRIATLFLALLAASLEWQSHGHLDEATAIAEEFLISTRTRTRGEPRFYPTIPNVPEFSALCRELRIQWKLPPGSKYKSGRMTHSLNIARSEVRDRCGSDEGFDGASLRALVLTLVDKVEIAVKNIAERHQPNEVFDRLNRAGQVLTVGDLVKNEIFRRLNADAPTAIDLYNEHWKPFEDSFADKKKLDDYYYPFTLTVDDTATVAGSFRALNTHWDETIRDESDPATTAEVIIEDLSRFVDQYNALASIAEYDNSPEISELVARLARMPAPRVTYSFLIQLLWAQRHGSLNAAAAAACLRIVESFLVRRAFSGREPTGLHAVFKGLWKKNSGNPQSLVGDLQTRTIDFPDDEQIKRDIIGKPFYGRRLGRYVLAELEIASHRTNPFTLEQLQNITVDHIAPRSLKGKWREHFPDDAEDRGLLVDLLGNLIPLSQSDNSTKGTSDWPEAQSRLSNETIYRTARTVLNEYDEWGPDQIRERTAILAAQAVERWPRSLT